MLHERTASRISPGLHSRQHKGSRISNRPNQSQPLSPVIQIEAFVRNTDSKLSTILWFPWFRRRLRFSQKIDMRNNPQEWGIRKQYSFFSFVYFDEGQRFWHLNFEREQMFSSSKHMVAIGNAVHFEMKLHIRDVAQCSHMHLESLNGKVGDVRWVKGRSMKIRASAPTSFVCFSIEAVEFSLRLC